MPIPGLAEARAHQRAPLGVSITDQHAMAAQDTVVCLGDRATDLAHECVVGMGRRTNDVHARRGQVDDKDGVRIRAIVDRTTRCPTFFDAPRIRVYPRSGSPPPSLGSSRWICRSTPARRMRWFP